jgi:tryptophan-rich sensory protein
VRFNFFKLLTSLTITLAAGWVGSIFTMPAIDGWYAGLVKPALNPPSWVFGPVWSLLYVLMGIALFLVWKNDFLVIRPLIRKRPTWNRLSERLWVGDLQKVNIILVFLVQYILNIKWSFLFFYLKSPILALLCIIALWVAILYTIVNFYRVSRAAAWLLLPYLAWVSFATYLNFMFWQLN